MIVSTPENTQPHPAALLWIVHNHILLFAITKIVMVDLILIVIIMIYFELSASMLINLQE